MAILLKNLYSQAFYDTFLLSLEEVLPSINKKGFIHQIFDSQWESLELKDRMKHTSSVLQSFLPTNFSESAKLIEKIIKSLRQKGIRESSLEYMFLPHYIETYGINDYNTSIHLIEQVTQFTSCEFAVRPFIIKYGERMIGQMFKWSLHDNPHVRRLASEGSRPRLPWAIALTALKANPAPNLPMLENLKNDPSEYVRRSVANHLNDISKDHPDILIAIARKWKGHSKETDAVIKHASRTLLKNGCPSILEQYDLLDHSKIITSSFSILTPEVMMGNPVEFSFSIQNDDQKTLNVRIEYAIHYLRKNGLHAKKVFKISERQLKASEKINIKRRQSFKIITTRKFYIGHHKLSLIINGKEKEIDNFKLISSGH